MGGWRPGDGAAGGPCAAPVWGVRTSHPSGGSLEAGAGPGGIRPCLNSHRAGPIRDCFTPVCTLFGDAGAGAASVTSPSGLGLLGPLQLRQIDRANQVVPCARNASRRTGSSATGARRRRCGAMPAPRGSPPRRKPRPMPATASGRRPTGSTCRLKTRCATPAASKPGATMTRYRLCSHVEEFHCPECGAPDY